MMRKRLATKYNANLSHYYPTVVYIICAGSCDPRLNKSSKNTMGVGISHKKYIRCREDLVLSSKRCFKTGCAVVLLLATALVTRYIN